MLEDRSSRFSDDLLREAMLYAAGELDRPTTAAFEARLANDQAAREALAEAVRLTTALFAPQNAQPNRAYRRVVRQKLGLAYICELQRRQRFWQHTSAALAALSAVLLLVVQFWSKSLEKSAAESFVQAIPELDRLVLPTVSPIEPLTMASRSLPANTPPAPPKADAVDRLLADPNAAVIWAKIPWSGHIEKATQQKQRRLQWQQRMRSCDGSDAELKDSPNELPES